ncbi:hypothetical protein CK203_098128 [Vitis vinifera]|uniref:Uncharacterized protein n=1 Tax=Vitis vinifera TaxID=29760 RepID=A0A438C671_VITVI|nr:hypothetical protein CK203_098128 [Vitis vinifera]
MCGGDFMNKNPEEAMDFLSYVVKFQEDGMSRMLEKHDMKAKVAAMARRLEELEMKKIREVQAISETPVQAISCSICQSFNTWWRSVLRFQLNHPNFSWKPRAPQYTQPGQVPPQASNLEQAIVNLSKAHQLNTCKRKESFLLNLIRIPRVSMKWRLRRRIFTGEGSQSSDTLRSGKEVDLPTSKPEHEPVNEAEKEKRRKSKERENGTVERMRTLNLL